MNARPWRVYTAEDKTVVSTLWTSGGPQTDSRTEVMTLDTAEDAAGFAELCQREYDTIQAAFTPAATFQLIERLSCAARKLVRGDVPDVPE